jgi:uracil-DNA glycosylase
MHVSSLSELNEQIIACRKCLRLVAWREQVACEKRAAYRNEDYWGRPVPGYGDISGSQRASVPSSPARANLTIQPT